MAAWATGGRSWSEVFPLVKAPSKAHVTSSRAHSGLKWEVGMQGRKGCHHGSFPPLRKGDRVLSPAPGPQAYVTMTTM
jgi:hypothetical protein